MKKALLLLLILLQSWAMGQDLSTIAVLDLVPKGLSEIEAEMLTDRLRSNLVQLNLFTIVDRDNMEEILEEQAFQLTGCTTEACAVQIGQLLGVQKMLTGSIGKLGRLYSVQLNLLDIETGKIERSTTYDFQGEIEMLLLEGMNTALLQLFGLMDMATSGAVSATQKTGSLNIESIPTNCSVQIDGKTVGNTPLNISGIKAGIRTIVLSYEGLQNFTSFLNIKLDTENTLTASLKSIYAIVDLRTDVPDAKIYFNDALMSEGTLQNNQINRGNYRIKIVHPNYNPFTDIIELNPNDTLKRDIKLVPRMGILNIESNPIPIRAKITLKTGSHSFYLNTEKENSFSTDYNDSFNADIQKGHYTLTLSSSTYYPILKSFTISESETTTLHLPLKSGLSDYKNKKKSVKRGSWLTVVSGISGGVLYMLANTYYDEYQNAMTPEDAESFRNMANLANIGSAACFSFSISLGGYSGYKAFQMKKINQLISVGK